MIHDTIKLILQLIHHRSSHSIIINTSIVIFTISFVYVLIFVLSSKVPNRFNNIRSRTRNMVFTSFFWFSWLLFCFYLIPFFGNMRLIPKSFLETPVLNTISSLCLSLNHIDFFKCFIFKLFRMAVLIFW